MDLNRPVIELPPRSWSVMVDFDVDRGKKDVPPSVVFSRSD